MSLRLGWEIIAQFMSHCWRKWWKSVERDKSTSATGPQCMRKTSFLFYDCMNCLTSRQFSFNSTRLPHFCLSLHMHIPICVCVQAGSLPSQLCPCARAISLCLTFTAQLPIDRPPLHHFVRLTITHHEPKEEKGKILCFLLFCFKKKSLTFFTSNPPARVETYLQEYSHLITYDFIRAGVCSATAI